MNDNKEQSNLCTYTGEFNKYLWRDEKTGDCVFLFSSQSKPVCSEAVIGTDIYKNRFSEQNETYYTMRCEVRNTPVPLFYSYEPIFVIGTFDMEEQDEHGTRFHVSSAEYWFNNSMLSFRFLSSKSFPKVSDTKAESIIRAFGPDLTKIANSPNAIEQIEQVTKMTHATVGNLVGKLQRHMREHELFDYVTKSGVNIPYYVVANAISEFGINAKQKIKSNPYCLEEFGLSYFTCDAIAKGLGFQRNNICVVEAFLKYLVDRVRLKGNTWITKEDFFEDGKRIGDQLGIDMIYISASEIVFKWFQNDLKNYDGMPVVINKELVDAEQRVANNLIRLSSGIKEKEPLQNNMIEKSEELCGITFGQQQKTVLKDVLGNRGVHVLTGGPGTGKTTLIQGIISCYKLMHSRHIIKLCAPTGRAAQRMAEQSKHEATTIHRLLEFRYVGGSLVHKNKNNPIEADMIIVDEMSMVDTEVMDMLLDAVQTGTKLILIGDPSQLEPIGAGQILKDLINMDDNIVQKCRLTEVYRQSYGSAIVQNAYKILCQKTDLIQCQDFRIINANTANEAVDDAKSLMNHLYDKTDPFTAQVLCPCKKGNAGVYVLNKKLQEMLNPDCGKPAYRYEGTCFREGDKVIMQRNKYTEPSYYNGDIGIIQQVNDDGIIVQIRGKDIQVTRDYMDDMLLAYAITVHKSQGSEFENVVIVLTSDYPNMLYNNLLYTAVTRASEHVYIIQTPKMLFKSIKTTPEERNSLLMPILEKHGELPFNTSDFGREVHDRLNT